MYKVLKNFTDKNTKAKYKVGDEVDFTEKRAKEILTVGNLIEKIEEVQLMTSQVVEETVEEVKPRKRGKK